MSSKYDHPIGDVKEGQEDIQLADQVTTWKCREACTSRAQTEVDTFEHKIGVNEGTELLNKTEKAMNTSRGGTDDFIKIQQVPRIMLQNEDFREYFKPRELSIGPIHAADPNLFKMELKLKLAAYFIKESGKTKDDFLKQIKTGIKDIRTFFVEEVITSYTDDQLIWLLFLDGCAMLGFVHCFVNRRLNELSISNGQAALIQQDLFLLENQIPFKVLALLMGIGGSQPIYRRPIDKSQKYFFKFLIASNVINFPGDLKDLKGLFKNIDQDRNPVHVLDLLRDVITADGVINFNCLSFIKLLVTILCSCGLVIPLMICKYVCAKVPYDEDFEQWSKKQSFRSVQELKTAGVRFKQNDITLREISFNFRGRLNHPTLVVDNSTQRMLLNLVAHEMCFSYSHPNQDPWVTYYVNLLDWLIDNEQDVKDLREVGVLQTILISDIGVVRLIKSISSNCVPPHYNGDPYKYVKKRIGEYCRSRYRRRCAIWMAQAYKTYFSSPWTILGLFAATAILALTAVQTWYAVNPRT